eukprot:1159259-Pelagomonas_calceolata.AAC.3
MTATISVSLCPPVRDFEREGLIRLIRGEPLALLNPGIWILAAVFQTAIIAKVGMSDGSKFAIETWLGSDEFGIGLVIMCFLQTGRNMKVPVAKNDGVGSMAQDLGHSILIINGMAD